MARPVYCQSSKDLIHRSEETGCTCDRPQSGQPSVPLEIVAEVYHTISNVRPASARGVSRVLNLPNSTVRKILRSVLNMFSFRFQRVQMLEARDNQSPLDLANNFLIRYDEDSSLLLPIL